MPDEEALLVVVGVDEPAGDALGSVAAYLTGVGVEHVDAVHPDPDLPGLGVVGLGSVEDVDVRLPEDHEEITLAVFFSSPAMCRSAFMRALRTGMRPSLLNSVACAS